MLEYNDPKINLCECTNPSTVPIPGACVADKWGGSVRGRCWSRPQGSTSCFTMMFQTSTYMKVQTLAHLPYPEHALQTSGEAVYVADVGVSTRELFAAPVESTCALAKLGKVDPALALKLPGVVAFVGMCLFVCLLPLSCVSSFSLPLLSFGFTSFLSSSVTSHLLLLSFSPSLSFSYLPSLVFVSLLLLVFQSVRLISHQNGPFICSEAAQLCSPPFHPSASASSMTISSLSFSFSFLLCFISSFIYDACAKLPEACLLHW